ncbi:hypothetical protein SDC9_100205 [bioreactor metagenome]|uniref:Uncharacterized protein n=1 Tax=bioreactor metagenome TaxID=1076179 RepID=A0A645AK77_9ZZZZ
MDPGSLQDFGVLLAQHDVVFKQDFSGFRMDDVVYRVTPLEAFGKGLNDLPVLDDLGNNDALFGTAVLFANNDFLGNVHQTAGQITGVGGTQSGIGQAFTRASG